MSKSFMPINNGVFCNQIPLPWGEKESLFMDSADRVCIIPGLFTLRCRSRLSLYQGAHLQAPYLPQMFCNDLVIKGTCPGTVMWPFHLYCRILTASVGCFLIEQRVGRGFFGTTKLQPWLTMLWAFVWRHCHSQSHTTIKQAIHTVVFFVCLFL